MAVMAAMDRSSLDPLRKSYCISVQYESMSKMLEEESGVALSISLICGAEKSGSSMCHLHHVNSLNKERYCHLCTFTRFNFNHREQYRSLKPPTG